MHTIAATQQNADRQRLLAARRAVVETVREKHGEDAVETLMQWVVDVVVTGKVSIDDAAVIIENAAAQETGNFAAWWAGDDDDYYYQQHEQDALRHGG